VARETVCLLWMAALVRDAVVAERASSRGSLDGSIRSTSCDLPQYRSLITIKEPSR